MNCIIKHNPKEGRFEMGLGDKTAYLDYQLSGTIITLIYVYTPPEYRGKGIAAQIAKFALDYAMDNKLKVIPQCPYIRDYIGKHEEYQGLLK